MRTLLLLPALFLAGCAGAVQVGPAAPDPDPVVIGAGSGASPNTIVVYRGATFGPVTNALTNPALTLDGRSVGTCRVGAPLVVRVPDGTWEIGAITGSGTTSRAVSVAGGETAYLQCGTEASLALGPRPDLQPVSVETGQRQAGL